MISHISFASIPATDLDRAIAFWRDTMGFELTFDSTVIESMRWVMLRPPGAETHIHLDRVDAIPRKDVPALPLIAPDVAGTVEKLRKKGTEIVMEPKPAEWDPETTYALFRDSEGNVILIASQ